MEYYYTTFMLFDLILYVRNKFAVRYNKCKDGYSKSNIFDTKTLYYFWCWIKQYPLLYLIAKKKTKVCAKRKRTANLQ